LNPLNPQEKGSTPNVNPNTKAREKNNNTRNGPFDDATKKNSTNGPKDEMNI